VSTLASPLRLSRRDVKFFQNCRRFRLIYLSRGRPLSAQPRRCRAFRRRSLHNAICRRWCSTILSARSDAESELLSCRGLARRDCGSSPAAVHREMRRRSEATASACFAWLARSVLYALQAMILREWSGISAR
jgi:hypothetical protein